MNRISCTRTSYFVRFMWTIRCKLVKFRPSVKWRKQIYHCAKFGCCLSKNIWLFVIRTLNSRESPTIYCHSDPPSPNHNRRNYLPNTEAIHRKVWNPPIAKTKRHKNILVGIKLITEIYRKHILVCLYFEIISFSSLFILETTFLYS